MPKVSVIVPNYNHVPYLKQRFDSIFNQTFQDFEVIILDDCSTDNSREIIEQYRSNPKVSHIVYNETNSGSPFKQWAKGFELAKGEYIWIAESDDWASEDFLIILMDKISHNSSISFVFSNSNIVSPNEQSILHNAFDSFTLNGKKFIKSRLFFDNFPHNASSVVFRKSNLKFISHDYQNFKNAGDWLFWINNSEIGNIAYIDKPLNFCRKHSKNTTEKNLKNGVLFSECQKVFFYLRDKGYMSFFKEQMTIQYEVYRIKYYLKTKELENNPLVMETLNKWEELISSFSQSICFTQLLLIIITKSSQQQVQFFKQNFYLSIHQNLSVLEIVWKILHLPNTNFRNFIKNHIHRILPRK